MANVTVNPFATAAGAVEPYNSPAGFDQPLVANGLGDLRVSQHLPPKSELVRMGQGWDLAIATANAFTYVNAWPTTRAELVLNNNETAGGKSYIIDSAWMANISSQGAANPITLLVQNVPVVGTAVTNDTAQLISSLSGKASYAGNGKRAVANSTAGQTTNLWRAVASTANAATATLGLAVIAELYGLYIVPPQGVFALAGLAGTAAGTAIIGVRWYEIQLTLG